MRSPISPWARAQVPPTGHVITANTGGADPRVGYSHYDAGGERHRQQHHELRAPEGGRSGSASSVSAAQASVTQQGLVVAVPADGGAGGQLFVHDRTVADATHVGSAGESPRMIRCSEQVCIVTNSGSNNATVFTWNGAATVANITNVAVGNVPQGVDIKKTGANYVAVVANASAGTVNVVVLNASAGVVSNTTVTLTGCANPRSVSHVPGTDTYAVACTIDNKIVVRAL
ncbi:MAG: hypothetical protein IPG50_30820 [Myxococcales bacterium]|nr:hypothetical protein [Myxococcales bacterium]